MKTVILSGIVAGLLAFSGVQNLSATLPAAAIDKAVEDTIKANVVAYEKAFNAGDGPAVARMWAPDGAYINTDGWVSTGRDQLEKLHAKLFAEKPVKKMRILVGSLSDSGPDAVVERGITAITDAAGNTISRSPYIAIHRKVGTEWLLQSVVEMSPNAVRASVQDLSWMLGSWLAPEGKVGVSLNNKFQPGGKFLISDFQITDKATNNKPEHEMMITALNPETGKLQAWIFDANGGYGRGQWWQENGAWYLVSHRIKPDGTQVDATHILTRDGDNSMQWRTTNRTADGVALADVPVVTITRTSANQ